MSITGITIVRNGNLLKYPWKLCIESMLTCCDEVIVNCDPDHVTDDGTWSDLHHMKNIYRNIKILESDWDMSNTGNGSMLAAEANKLLASVKTNWILYLQADELVHEKDAIFYKNSTSTDCLVPSWVSQIEMLRTYFWGSLNKRYTTNELYLGRLFRAGTHIVGGDGMHLTRLLGDVYRSERMIYHYSRMGKEEEVTARIRTLDRLFHDEKEVLQMKPFSYSEALQENIISYHGTHPAGIEKFYE